MQLRLRTEQFLSRGEVKSHMTYVLMSACCYRPVDICHISLTWAITQIPSKKNHLLLLFSSFSELDNLREQ